MSDLRDQPYFFTDFPLEISTRIFSYLDKRDCLTCMSVCRFWYSAVPQYSRSMWTTLTLLPGDIYLNNKRWQSCIGDHVELVMFDGFDEEGELFDAMRTLIDCGCTQIKVINFDDCSTSNQEELVTLLKQLFAAPAQQLTFAKHRSDLDLLHVLSACPTITHFLYTQKDHDGPNLGMEPPATAPPEFTLDNLVRITLSTKGIAIVEKLVPVLQRCPNLEYLGYLEMDRDGEPPGVIDMDQLFSWCPKLQYLEMNSNVLANVSNLPVMTNWTEDDASNLRCLVAHQMDPDEIMPHLNRNAGALKHLKLSSIKSDSADWTPVLQDLQYPQLGSLDLRDIMYHDSALDAIFKNCPALEALILVGDYDVDFHIQKALRCLTQLKRLEVDGVNFCYDDEEISMDSLTDMVDQLALGNSKLQEIELRNLGYLSDQLLLTLSALPAIKRLVVLSVWQAPLSSDDVLCYFFEMLSQTQIEFIVFSGLRHLPSCAARALGDSCLLRHLQLFGYGFQIDLDATSLVYLLQNCKSLMTFSVTTLGLTGTEDDVPTFLRREAPNYRLDMAYLIDTRYAISLVKVY